jgi:ligand-binding sensor domain-containing protein
MRKHPFFLLPVIIAVFFLSPNVYGQEQLWQSFTNMRSVRGYYEAGRPYTFSRLMASSPQGVWAATTGGILLWDHSGQAFRKFTNTDGLSQNDTKAIGRDRRGRLWIALANGLIDVYDFDKDVFSQIDDYRPNNRRIYDFLTKGDSMYIALDVGISLYDVARNEVKETYQNLGEKFPRASVVTSLFNDGRELWAATNNGVARTSLDLPNLFAPESWTNYTVQEGLPSAVVNGFAKLGQSIVAATANGVAVFNGQWWSDISAGLVEREIRQLITASENNRPVLYAATPYWVYRSEALGQWAPVGSGLPTTITGIIIDNAGTLWASTYDAGLYEYDRPAQTWRMHEPEGLPRTVFPR